MSLTNYKVIQTASPDELAVAVNAAITGGAQPYGSPIAFLESSNRLFFQAVADGSPDGGGSLPDTEVAVADGATLAVLNSAGADSHDATAAVSGGVMTSLKLAATVAFVDNSDSVSIRNSAGGDQHPGTAVVANGVITSVNLGAAVAMVDSSDLVAIKSFGGATIAGNHGVVVTAGVLTNVVLDAGVAGVATGATVPVQNSAGADPHNGTCGLTSGSLTSVKLASTVAMVDSGDTFPGVTGSGTTATFTVTNGVISGIVLS